MKFILSKQTIATLLCIALLWAGTACTDNTENTADTDTITDTVTDTDSDTDTDTDTDTDSDTDTDTDTDSDTDTDTATVPVEPVGDECNTTGECQSIYPAADDCSNSQSDTSRCMCGDVECWTIDSTTDTDSTPDTDSTDVSGWRWAHSGDGNQHDPDDWHASAMALALLYRADLLDKLVHFDWNNHLGDNSDSMVLQHNTHVETAISTFGYDDSVFWDCQEDVDAAVADLARVINASSAQSPLLLTCAGPMEVCWRGINAANPDSRQYVTVVSHSNWNDNHEDTPEMTHTWSDIEDDFNVTAHHINDQNPPAFKSDCTDWNWLNQIPSYGSTLYDLMCGVSNAAGDASDAGMLYYIIDKDGKLNGTSGTSNPSMDDVKTFFGVN